MQQEIRNQIVDINSVDVNLLCEICKKLTINPKECGECQHLFCQSCIIDWWKNNSKCPNCETQISSLQEPHRLVLNAISLIKVKCFNIDCDKIGIIGDIDSHMKECEYNKQICKFLGCGLMFNQVELKDHFNICEYRIIICEKCHNKHSIKEDCIEVIFLHGLLLKDQIFVENAEIAQIELAIVVIFAKQIYVWIVLNQYSILESVQGIMTQFFNRLMNKFVVVFVDKNLLKIKFQYGVTEPAIMMFVIIVLFNYHNEKLCYLINIGGHILSSILKVIIK